MLAEQLLSEMIPKSEFIELDNIILSDTIILYYNRIINLSVLIKNWHIIYVMIERVLDNYK